VPKAISEKYDLLPSQAYVGKEKSFARTVIGDEKQQDFLPQVKLERWDNEVNFSVRLAHQEAGAQVRAEEGKIKWVGEKVEAHFYEVGSLEERGGFEFEVICHERPQNDRVQMTLQAKGLDFFYQAELTPEEVAMGCFRPENVVGSYAVYHATQAGDYSRMGGKNYKAGKFCHIYRPRLEDAAGNWTWGELNVDLKAGLLTVTAPKEFWNSAIYPVRHAAGLTFGYTSIGASTDTQGANNTGLRKATSLPAVDGYLESISFYCKYYSGPADFNTAIYADNANPALMERLAYMNSGGTAMGSSFGWVTTPLSYSGITAGAQYWLGHYYVSQSYQYKYDSGISAEGRYIGSSGGFPNPWGSSNSSSQRQSIYATYTAGGGGANLYPAGIASGEAAGELNISQGPAALYPPAIPTGETVGVPSIVPGPVTLAPQGMPIAGALGLPAFTPGPVSLTGAGNIPGGAAFGLPAIALGPISISAAGNIASQETCGPLTITTGPVAIIGAGSIPSGEAFGLPTVGYMQFVDLPENLALALDLRRLGAVPILRHLVAYPQITRLQVTPDA
jgi:hypothetical protein